MLIDMSADSRNYPTAIKRMGVTGIMRYSSRGGGDKCITAGEYAWLLDAGLEVGALYEEWGGASRRGLGWDINAADGTLDGLFATGFWKQAGFPQGRTIYFCIDVDVDTDVKIERYVIPYLNAVRTALGGYYEAGVYGGGSTCAAALDACGFKFTMLAQSMGYTGTQEFISQKRATIIQGPDHGWYDGPNQVLVDDWGGWRPNPIIPADGEPPTGTIA